MLTRLEQSEPTTVWFRLWDKVTAEVNLQAAYWAVRRNGGAPGVDGQTVKQFEAYEQAELAKLREELRSKSYRRQPGRRVWIPKPGSTEKRPLGIPTVRDRVAQEVVRRLLTPIFEPLFHEASKGFRPGRNCHQALGLAMKYHEEGFRVILDADIVGFFDNLSQSLIKEAVAAQVADGNILNLVEKFLRAGVMEAGVFKPTTVGTPQGGVISPLLANIVLNHLDWQLDKLGYRFARYADDFVVLCQTHAQAEEAQTQVIEELNRVIRGTANYFTPRWSTNRWLFQKLDSWIRRRLRCMKFGYFSYHHNHRMRLKQFAKLGLLSLESFCWS